MSKGDKNITLGNLFCKIAKGNPSTMGILKMIAKTARQIDPQCPHGAMGVLSDIEASGLSPVEITKLYKVAAGSNPKTMNALFYGIYLDVLTSDDLKKAGLDGGKNLQMQKIMRAVHTDNKRFGQYYSPKRK